MTCAMRRPCSLGEREVLIDVALRIDDGGGAASARRRSDTTRAPGNSDKTDGGSCALESAHYGQVYTRGISRIRRRARRRVHARHGCPGSWRGEPLAAQPAPSRTGGEPDLIVVNARVLTSDAAQPRAEAFAVKNGRFIAVGSTSDVRNLATRAHAGHRRAAHDGRARLHRCAQPSERRRRSSTASTPTCAPCARFRRRSAQKAETTRARGLGHRLHVRRHQARSAADAQGSRRGDDRASGVGRAPRRPHELLQQQGVRAGRHHRRTRPIRPTAASSARTAS